MLGRYQPDLGLGDADQQLADGARGHLDHLGALAEQGVEILTCGTCLDHFGIKDQLAVGEVTNMYVIVEKMEQAVRVVRP